MAEKKSSSSDGMKAETKALLSWLFSPITSLIWMGEADKNVKFHALQSLYWGIFSIVMWIVLVPLLSLITLGFGALCLIPAASILDLGVRIYMAVQANKGEKTKLPVIGDMAEKNM